MQYFFVAFDAVFPLFLIMLTGFLFQRSGLISEKALCEFNTVCFRVLLSCNLFYSVYRSDWSGIARLSLLGYCLAAVGVEIALARLLSSALTKDRRMRGAMGQALIRTNMMLVGMPIAQNLFGEAIGPFPLAVAVIVPIYNFFGVVILERNRGDGSGRQSLARTLKNVITNPLIVAALIAFLFQATGLRLPASAESVVASFSKSATPIALFILGGSLHFSSVRQHRRELLLTALLRTVAFPFLFTAIGAMLGFRGADLLTVMLTFGCPVATVCYVMAQQMDSDAEYTGGAVALTTVLSCLTLFCGILALKKLQLM